MCVCVHMCVNTWLCVYMCVCMRVCMCVCWSFWSSMLPLSTLQVVLDDFSLTIPAGKVTALCGLSGAGQLGSESTYSTVQRGWGGCGRLEEHSMCGQKMEAVTVTTDNLWYAVLWVGGWGLWSGCVELWSGWVGPVEWVDGTVVCEVEKNTFREVPTKWHYCVCTIHLQLLATLGDLEVHIESFES